MAKPHQDPLSLVLPHAKSSARRALKRFASGEHVWLGDAGALLAAGAARRAGLDVADSLFTGIRRMFGKETFRYGELVALSGDFYGSPADLFEEHPGLLPQLWEQNDTSDLRQLFAREVAWIEARQQARGSAKYPSYDVRMAWNAKSYVELALINTDHFGWHNMLAYCRHHLAALALARRAQGKEGELWSRALVYNAFADHFLTDGFAAGHIRVPRAQIRAWATLHQLGEKTAGALSKLLHDQDGHFDTVHDEAGDPAASSRDGLPVANARGDRWRTYCDGQLFAKVGVENAPPVQLPVEAVAASLGELLVAWKKNKLPQGVFAATRLVPFPDPSAPGLADKFRPDDKKRIDALFRGTAPYLKIPWIGPGLKRTHITALFAALPQLMAALRDAVGHDLEVTPWLSERLAPEYVAAFKKVR